MKFDMLDNLVLLLRVLLLGVGESRWRPALKECELQEVTTGKQWRAD